MIFFPSSSALEGRAPNFNARLSDLFTFEARPKNKHLKHSSSTL